MGGMSGGSQATQKETNCLVTFWTNIKLILRKEEHFLLIETAGKKVFLKRTLCVEIAGEEAIDEKVSFSLSSIAKKSTSFRVFFA